MWGRENAKTKSARKKRTGIEWATRSTNIEATLASAREPAPWPPRAFPLDATTLAPEDVVEYVSDEYEVAARPIAATRALAPRSMEIGAVASERRPSRLKGFVAENWPLAIAFVIAGALAWRLSAPVPAPVVPAAPQTTASVCADVPPAPSVEIATTTPLPTLSVAPVRPTPPPRPPVSVKRPAPKPPPSSNAPAPEATTKATAESQRALDLALTELASY